MQILRKDFFVKKLTVEKYFMRKKYIAILYMHIICKKLKLPYNNAFFDINKIHKKNKYFYSMFAPYNT